MRGADVARSFVLAALVLLALSVPDRASSNSGRLILELEGEPLVGVAPSVVLSGQEKQESILLGAFAMAEGRVRIDDVPPGAYRIALEPAGSLSGNTARSLEVGIHPGSSTIVHLNLETGRLYVDPFRPDPFGVDETWDGGWLEILPGAGEEAALAALTSPAPPRQASIEGLDVTGSGFRHRLRLGAESIARSVRIPLGPVPASQEEAVRELLVRRQGAYGDVEAATGDAGQTSWEGTFARNYPSVIGRPRLFGSIRGLKYLDAAPSVFENGRRPHSGLESLELMTRLDLRLGPRSQMTGLLYGEGTIQKYLLESYRFNPRHAPKEERAVLQGALRVRHDLRRGVRLLGELSIQRTFVESGDGTFFDDLPAYQRSANVPTDEDGLYWLEGHTYDYFLRKVHFDLTARLEAWRDPGSDRTDGIGLWIRRGVYRGYEHLKPTRGPIASQVSSIGYEIGGGSRSDQAGREPGRPWTVSAFATARRPLAGGDVEVGLRATHYRPGQKPLSDLSDPLGEDGTIGSEDLRDPTTSTTLDPRVAFTRPLPGRMRLWISSGIETWLPPSEAVYYSIDFLNPRAYDATMGESSTLIFGNPALKPERVWTGLAAIGMEVLPALWLRVGLEGQRIAEAITPRAIPVGTDSLVYYVNDGRRDLIDLSLRATWEPSPRFRARASYDLSRMRTETVEPTLLDEAWTTPELPSRGVDQHEGLPSVFPPHDDGRNRGLYPSIHDRRHRIAFAAVAQPRPDLLGEPGRPIFSDLEIGLLFRLSSGRPFTQTQPFPTGLLVENAATQSPPEPPNDAIGSPVNGVRTDWVGRLDLRLARTLRILGLQAQAWLEVMNLTNERNERIVYQATGQGDDDGWLDYDLRPVEQQTAEFVEAYRARILDTNNYGDPRLFRAGIRIRIPY